MPARHTAARLHQTFYLLLFFVSRLLLPSLKRAFSEFVQRVPHFFVNALIRQVVLKEFPERSIPIYTELHDLIEAVRGELKTYNDNEGGEDDAGAFNANEGLWTVRYNLLFIYSLFHCLVKIHSGFYETMVVTDFVCTFFVGYLNLDVGNQHGPHISQVQRCNCCLSHIN